MNQENCWDSKSQTGQTISHLERREIQAPLAAALIRGFAETLGFDRAIETASAIIGADAEKAGIKTSETYGSNTLHELRDFICKTWAQNDAIVIREMEETPNHLSFRVIRCRYAELYEKMGIRDLGYCLSCSRDEPFARGFNPRIRMARTKTIMQGDAFCDFLFTLENPPDSDSV